jgi:hypothetical protein
VRLAKASGTTHMPVTVWSWNKSPEEAAGPYLPRLLRRLGYRVRVRNISAAQYFTIVFDAHRKIQMGLIPWIADFATPSDFFLPF